MTNESVNQNIFGFNNRNAGNNYTENATNNYVIQHPWKQQLPMPVLNQIAIANESYFIERFGFDVSEEQRYQILSLKERFGLTDLNIKDLKRSGALTAENGQPVKLYSDWSGFLACMILLLLLGLVVLFFFSLLFVKGVNLSLALAVYIGLFTVYIFLFRDLHRVTIKPAKILWQTGIKFGETYIHSAS